MYCGECGAKNNDDAKFCSQCGKPLDVISPKVTNTKTQDAHEEKKKISFDLKKATGKIKFISKKAMIGVGIAFFVVILLTIFINRSVKTIDLNKYINVEESGYEGFGRAEISIDWDAIQDKYGEKIRITDEFREKYGSWTPINVLAEAVHVSLEKEEKLSNDEKIAYTFDVDKELLKDVKYRVKYKDDTYKMSKFEEVSTFDVFAEVEVSFSGSSPNGEFLYTYKGSELSEYDFDCDKRTGLRNGDIVKIYIDDAKMEAYINTLGKVPAESEKEYVVEGLDEYVEKYSDIAAEFLNKMKSEAEDTVSAHIANEYDGALTTGDLSYAGYIMNSIIDGGSSSCYNELYLIYSVPVSHVEKRFETTTIYYPIRFTNIHKNSEGFNFEDIEKIDDGTELEGYYVGGYELPFKCYVDLTIERKDSYTIKAGGKFEKYSNYEFIDTLEEIPDGFKESIQKSAEEWIKTFIKNDYNENTYAKKINYMGDYLLVSKDENIEIERRNGYFIVFSLVLSNAEDLFKPVTVYFPVRYTGLVKLKDGTCEFYNNHAIVGKVDIPDSNEWTYGYIDGTIMYKEIVTSNREFFKYEVSEGLKQFGE